MSLYKSEEMVSEDTMFGSGELVFDQILNWSDEYPEQLVLNQDEVLLQQQEDTMEATNKFSLAPHEFVPVTPIGPPEREIFSGDLKFEVEICGADTHKSKYLYSHNYNRIYVDMGYSFSVRLKWNSAAQQYPAMLVRATTVFSNQAQAEKRVTRCIQHYHDKSKNVDDMPIAMLGGVLHSSRDFGTQDVFYCGGESPDEWFSVVVRLAAPTTHAYQFTCKNSCSSGINRRPISIIFTLEDHTGKVWGRQSVGARVCSCPKRDKKRDEEEEVPRRKRPLVQRPTPPATVPETPPRGKKIRLVEVRREEDSNELIPLPQISVVGRRVFATGLGVMLNMMEEKRDAAARANLPTDQLDACVAQLRQHLEQQ